MAKKGTKEIFKMPTAVKITGRTSSVTNAFVNGIIPCVQPTEEEIDECLLILGLDKFDLRCAYCGNESSEWDHFRPIVRKKRPTGFITEIANLVPSCGKCNQSKSGSHWKNWMTGDAKNSPKTKGIADLKERVNRLEKYEQHKRAKEIDIEKIVGPELWEEYWNCHEMLHESMKKAQLLQDKVKEKIDEYVKNRK